MDQKLLASILFHFPCEFVSVIALAIFELGIGVGKEYSVPDEDENIYYNIRRTITRSVGTVCIALVLEALIMIIKYSIARTGRESILSGRHSYSRDRGDEG